MKPWWYSSVQDLELHPGLSCPGGCRTLSELRDRFSGRVLLRQFKNDGLRMSRLRDLLRRESSSYQLSRMTNDEVIREIADLLSRGSVHVHAKAIRTAPAPASTRTPSGSRAEPPLHPSVALRRSPRRMSARNGVNTLSTNADERAIVARLKTAAAAGIHFCEECLRKRYA